MRTINIPVEQIEFQLIQHESDIPVRGNAIDTGNDEEDKKTEDEILSDLNNGNLWAWCDVELIGRYKGLEVSEHLGACSYQSEEDFKVGGYYEDMQATIKAYFERMVSNIVEEHCK